VVGTSNGLQLQQHTSAPLHSSHLFESSYLTSLLDAEMINKTVDKRFSSVQIVHMHIGLNGQFETRQSMDKDIVKSRPVHYSNPGQHPVVKTITCGFV